jgi:hypothetical protein
VRTPDEVNALLHGHIQSLRENPFLADAKIMFIAEKNTGYESARMWDVVKDYPETFALWEHRKVKTDKERTKPVKNPGVNTSTYRREIAKTTCMP